MILVALPDKVAPRNEQQDPVKWQRCRKPVARTARPKAGIALCFDEITQGDGVVGNGSGFLFKGWARPPHFSDRGGTGREAIRTRA